MRKLDLFSFYAIILHKNLNEITEFTKSCTAISLYENFVVDWGRQRRCKAFVNSGMNLLLFIR